VITRLAAAQHDGSIAHRVSGQQHILDGGTDRGILIPFFDARLMRLEARDDGEKVGARRALSRSRYGSRPSKTC